MAADRELLELAARAARMTIGPGIGELVWWDGMDTFQIRCANGASRWWNPLNDDGDVLRLAIDTDTCIEFGYCLDDAPIVRCGRAEDRENWPQVGNFPDPYAATRRAIVEAVAAKQREYEAVCGPASVGEVPRG